jgi:heat shock protein HtpX
MDLTTRWLYKADFNAEIPDYLKNFINEVCKQKKIKYPRIGIIDDGNPNCYTYGRTKRDARIIITRGVFDLLSEEEVKAVIGHELGHVAHYDMLVMTVAQLIPIVFYAIYQACLESVSDDSDNKYNGIIAAIAFVLYIISQYIVLWLSRTREYYADSFSVDMTRNPNALAEALVKIGFGLTTTKEEEKLDEKGKPIKKKDVSSVKGLGIFDKNTSKTLVACSSTDGMSTNVSKTSIKNAMKWEKWNYWAKWYEFNSTHPLISKRLEAISKRSKEFNQEPYIVFDLVKPESYADDFAIEILLMLLPALAITSVVIFLVLMLSNEDYHSYKIGLSISGMLFVFFEFLLFYRKYKKSKFNPATVESLLGEVKVSGVTSIPCQLKGNIIGRGDAGYIFSEDFVIRDNTGIMFLDYNQPLWLINKIFAVFKAKTFIDKEVIIQGWYRRSPVPYVEIYSMQVDGKEKNFTVSNKNTVEAFHAGTLPLNVLANKALSLSENLQANLQNRFDMFMDAQRSQDMSQSQGFHR